VGRRLRGPAPFDRCRLSSLLAGKCCNAWNRGAGETSNCSFGPKPPKLHRKKNLPTRLAAPAHDWGRFPAGASGSMPCLRI
jgi:hypothetical protein